MSTLFSHLITQPILNLTIFLYGTVGFHDLGLAIIVMTLLIRVALLPLSLKSSRSQKALAELAPEVEAIKARHKGDNQAQSEAVMELYKQRNVNPLGGCLPLLIQLPILIGMYRVFLNIFKPQSLALLYTFVPHPAVVNHLFLGILDISIPNHILAVATGVFQFFQARLTMAPTPSKPGAPLDATAMMNKQMIYFLPIMIVVISWNLPAGLALYWSTTTLFSIGEQLYLRRR